MIQRRISLSPEPASPVNRGEPLKTIASREPSGFIFEIMCMMKSSEPSLMRGSPAPKRPFEPLLVVLALDHVRLRFPLDAEGRVGQEIVELVARQAVLGEAVTELDVLGILP